MGHEEVSARSAGTVRTQARPRLCSKGPHRWRPGWHRAAVATKGCRWGLFLCSLGACIFAVASPLVATLGAIRGIYQQVLRSATENSCKSEEKWETAGAGSLELPPWQVVRQGLLSLPFLFGAGVTHRLLQVPICPTALVPAPLLGASTGRLSRHTDMRGPSEAIMPGYAGRSKAGALCMLRTGGCGRGAREAGPEGHAGRVLVPGLSGRGHGPAVQGPGDARAAAEPEAGPGVVQENLRAAMGCLLRNASKGRMRGDE